MIPAALRSSPLRGARVRRLPTVRCLRSKIPAGRERPPTQRRIAALAPRSACTTRRCSRRLGRDRPHRRVQFPIVSSTLESDALCGRRLAREPGPGGVRLRAQDYPRTAPCSIPVASGSTSRRTTSPSTGRSWRAWARRLARGSTSSWSCPTPSSSSSRCAASTRVKNAALRELSLEAARRGREVGRCTSSRRAPELNEMADRLVNEALDAF